MKLQRLVLTGPVMLLLALFGIFQTPAARAQLPACQKTIDSGIVQGTLRGQSCVYLGIPYASPPPGNFTSRSERLRAGRWRPWALADTWNGVMSFTKFGSMCPQLLGGTPMGDEDCLNLNVFSPPNNAPLPVIFFMHGGGNRTNSNRAEAGELLDGQYLAEQGHVIVVVINYRLGALGWLAHPSLDAESKTGTSGNYGILDQIAALQWVQRNIAAFGGDPSRVMITGHSAGAADTAVLLASPLARGLFAKVLIDGSGSPFDQPTLGDYEANVGADVVTKLVCSNAADIPTCLRAVPSATIVKTVPGLPGLINEGTWKPVVDGFVLSDTPLQAAKEGEHNHVPLIVGGTDKEMSNPNFVPIDPLHMFTDAKYQEEIHTLFGEVVGNEVLTNYPSASYPTPRDALVAVATDVRFLCAARRLGRAVSNSQKEPVYRFVFTHAQSNPPLATALGAWHGEELMFIFHSFTSAVSGTFTPTEAELALSDQMIGYWARFAATGNPNGDDAPLPWFVYGQNADNNGQGNLFFTTDAQGDDKKDVFLQLDTAFAEGAGFHAEVCENFWDVLVADTNNGHGEGSIASDIDDNRGNEAFITDADLDNDDKVPTPPKD